MCYLVIISTDADVDLTVHNCELLKFTRELPSIAGSDFLSYAYRWYVQSQSLCSCTFRHALEPSLGFTSPVDWYPEDETALRATILFTGVIRALVEAGSRVDCVDLWNPGENMQPVIDRVDVDLAVVADNEFRFFENHYFCFLDSRVADARA